MPRTKETFAKQNEYNRGKYDRFSLMLPKGEKEKLQAIADKHGVSLNKLIYTATMLYVNKLEKD